MNNKITSPLVSVIIPTYNRAKYHRQCIESALSQDYPNLEVIVVDNGSTDNTLEILASFGNKIKCLKEGKRGISSARNKGLCSARGEFIALLDSDDFYLPGKISLSVRKLQEDHSISLVYTDYILVNPEGRQIRTVKKNHPPSEKFIRYFLRGLAGFVPSLTLLRKECLEKSGYFDETFLNSHEDTDMWFRMLKAGYRFGHIPEPLTAYRLHPDNFGRLKNNQEPIRLCWDKMCSSGIEYFTVPELFGDLLTSKEWKRKVKKEYDTLADRCFLRDYPLSGRAATKKSLEIGRPHSFFLFFFTNALQTIPILCNIAKATLKLILIAVNIKLARWDAGICRKNLAKLLCKLKYRLFKVFVYRYGLG